MPAPTPPSLYLQITRAIKGGDLFTLRGLLRNQSDWARLLGVDQVVDLPYDAACDAKWEIFQLLLANGFGRQNRRLAGKLIAGVCRADISEPEMLSRVDELLLQGADAGPPNPFLNIAAKRGYVSVVARLLDAGADVEDTSHDGVPVLHELAWMFRGDPTITQRGRYAVAELLLNHGADVNGGKTQKRMPIRQAVASGDLRMVRLLLQHGATANIANSWGDTPLHEAVIRHSDDSSGLIQSEESEVVETVRLLLAAGA
ncbi:MAG: ankyrin repeat domain-containing protein, partial [Fibrella sp.]|nr:ankyrin repeat domain-containing protein [Armatimonadota bacterium]